MQRNRNIRKIIQKPVAIEHATNIHRRQDKRNFVKSTHTQAVSLNVPSRVRVVNSAKPESAIINYSTVIKKFAGETIYILGGGPSLKDFDFRLLTGCRTLAINKALLFCPNIDILYWTDSRFYTWYKNDVDNYKGLKFTIKPGSQYTNDIQILKKGKVHGLEEDPQILAHGNNSGYAAINLAYHLGAKRIILLGFDMGSENGDTHFHDGYPSRPAGDAVYRDKFLPGFKQLDSELRKSGVMILNASPNSRLTTFTKITIEQALSFR